MRWWADERPVGAFCRDRERGSAGHRPRLRALIDEAAPASSGDAHPNGSGTHADPAITPRRVPVVTIDGYSGSGKSTLAAALVSLLPGWQILHLDDWYPGWDGLAGRAEVARRI